MEIENAIQEFILDSQICLDVNESFVREIFTAGAKWQRNKSKEIKLNQKPIAWMNSQGETTINDVQVEYWIRGGYEITPLYSITKAEAIMGEKS